jgi:hypothetical protein
MTFWEVKYRGILYCKRCVCQHSQEFVNFLYRLLVYICALSLGLLCRMQFSYANTLRWGYSVSLIFEPRPPSPGFLTSPWNGRRFNSAGVGGRERWGGGLLNGSNTFLWVGRGNGPKEVKFQPPKNWVVLRLTGCSLSWDSYKISDLLFISLSLWTVLYVCAAQRLTHLRRSLV